jgi:hypothetical protein
MLTRHGIRLARDGREKGLMGPALSFLVKKCSLQFVCLCFNGTACYYVSDSVAMIAEVLELLINYLLKPC